MADDSGYHWGSLSREAPWEVLNDPLLHGSHPAREQSRYTDWSHLDSDIPRPVFYIHLSWREATTHELGFPSEVESADVL